MTMNNSMYLLTGVIVAAPWLYSSQVVCGDGVVVVVVCWHV